MMVTRILGDCPGCGGKSSYGNVDVYDHYVLRGCRLCKYSMQIPLPPIQKSILYLDQCFFSGAFRKGDPRFTTIVNRIKEIAALQLVVVPYSSVHEDESHQWEHRAELMKFIKATSRGQHFEPTYRVEQVQILRAFESWLKGQSTDYCIEERDVLGSNVHCWEGYFRVEAGRYLGNIELLREAKRSSVTSLLDLFDEWRKSTSSFEEDVVLELSAFGRNYLETYWTFVCRMAKGDYNALFDSPVVYQVVQNMLRFLPKELPPDQALHRCAEFFGSEIFSKTPYPSIEARSFAQLKDMVRGGAYKNRNKAASRLSGLFYDLKHIATYAPYCHGFVMDQPMAELVKHPRLALEATYGVKVFSLNNLDELLLWLDTLEASMTEEHKEGLDAAYPLAVPRSKNPWGWMS
jgi:hypothetical protein